MMASAGKAQHLSPMDNITPPAPSRLAAVLSDIQFWVPVAVLVIGAVVLFWVSR